MRKKPIALSLLLGALLLLCSCMSRSGEDFYAVPQIAGEYLAVQNAVTQTMNDLGAEYAAPSSGSNIQNIQLQDLDGDGVQETAVAFLRVSGAEKALKIYFYQQNAATEEYEVIWVIEGDGTSFYSVSFEDFSGNGTKEIVVSWQISTKVQSLSVYALQEEGEVEELLHSAYTKVTLMDIDRDNVKEILLVQLSDTEDESLVEVYRYTDGAISLGETVALSTGVTEILSAKEGMLTEQIPALFVTAQFGESGGYVTDIIAMRNDSLNNITLQTRLQLSASTVRYIADYTSAYGGDINSDGITDLPLPSYLPAVEEGGTQSYLLHWNQYDSNGQAEEVCLTYHNEDDGWYLIIPEEWVGQIAIARKDSTTSTERGISFYHINANGEAEEFLTIYRLTGTNRTTRSTKDGRFVLYEGSDVIYAAKLQTDVWDCGLTEEDLIARFALITASWSEDD